MCMHRPGPPAPPAGNPPPELPQEQLRRSSGGGLRVVLDDQTHFQTVQSKQCQSRYSRRALEQQPELLAEGEGQLEEAVQDEVEEG